MQIPSSSDDPFLKTMSEMAQEVRAIFLENVRSLTNKVPVKVMLGDGTVSEQESFDPSKMRQFYSLVLSRLSGWTTSGASVTSDQDLRRSFVKFEKTHGNYALSCHMSLQYHALLFYKLDHKVLDVQKDLNEVTDRIKQIQESTAPENDTIIREKLRVMGYQDVDQQKLFEILFENDKLTQELEEVIKSRRHELEMLVERQRSMFEDLDNLLIEVYHTSPVLIDEMKMIAAEEGCLCNFNLEYLKKSDRNGNIDLGKIPRNVKDELVHDMGEIVKVLTAFEKRG